MTAPFEPNDPKLLAALRALHQRSQTWCTDEDFQVIHDDDRDWAAEQVKTGFEGNMFVVHGVNRETGGDRIIMPVMFADWPPPETIGGKPFGKRGAMVSIAQMWVEKFPDHMPVVVSHLAEGWLAQQTSEKLPADFAPSKDPNRKEVVIVATSSLDQRISHSYREILRDAAGTFTGLGDEFGAAYTPGQPVDPRERFDNGMMYFFMGYFAARGLK